MDRDGEVATFDVDYQALGVGPRGEARQGPRGGQVETRRFLKDVVEGRTVENAAPGIGSRLAYSEKGKGGLGVGGIPA